MTVPVSLHDHIRLLASYGWGHEDICVRLKITGPARVRVRELVLGIDDDRKSDPLTDRPLTVRQVAERMGISRCAVYDAIRDGKLQALKLSPKLIRILPVEVDRWINGSSTARGDDDDKNPHSGSDHCVALHSSDSAVLF